MVHLRFLIGPQAAAGGGAHRRETVAPRSGNQAGPGGRPSCSRSASFWGTPGDAPAPFGELDLDVPGHRIHRARTEHADLGIDGAENVVSEAPLHGAD
jgi:hypothetical protein